MDPSISEIIAGNNGIDSRHDQQELASGLKLHLVIDLSMPIILSHSIKQRHPRRSNLLVVAVILPSHHPNSKPQCNCCSLIQSTAFSFPCCWMAPL
mmetsp:Transcript_8141/g.20315  ORF Transcript_8141/g.20315 Transcript_8141/m.20315 type:complete len:96 (+) Transcript_8141:331-618(+)